MRNIWQILKISAFLANKIKQNYRGSLKNRFRFRSLSFKVVHPELQMDTVEEGKYLRRETVEKASLYVFEKTKGI